MMSRRPFSSTRRNLGGGIFGRSKSKLLLVFLGVFLVAYLYWSPGVSGGSEHEPTALQDNKDQGISSFDGDNKQETPGLDASRESEFTSQNVSDGSKQESTRFNGDNTCSSEAKRAIPTLKKAYDGSTQRILHVGSDSCSVVSELLKEEDIEAFGVEVVDMKDAAQDCQKLVRRGIIRVGDLKVPLPYREDSFSLVIVSDIVDYLSTRYLNSSLPDLARVSSDGLIIFAGNPNYSTSRAVEISKFGSPARRRKLSWWRKFFDQINLEVDEDAMSKFEQAALENQYTPRCQVFLIKPFL